MMKLAAATAALPLVHIRSGRAAGKLSIAFWDHWVPSGNAVMQKQVDAWGAKNQVEVQADFITSVGSKNLLTIAAEAQQRRAMMCRLFRRGRCITTPIRWNRWTT